MTEPTLKGGNLILSDFSVSDRAEPGEAVRFRIELSNGALNIAPWDPDGCAPEGYKVAPHIIVPGGDDRQVEVVCLGVSVIGVKTKTFEGTFIAPDAGGDYTLEAYMELPESGTTSTTAIDTLTVTEKGTTAPPPNGGDDTSRDNGDDDDDGDDSDGKNLLQIALNNPKGALALGIGGIAALNVALN